MSPLQQSAPPQSLSAPAVRIDRITVRHIQSPGGPNKVHQGSPNRQKHGGTEILFLHYPRQDRGGLFCLICGGVSCVNQSAIMTGCTCNRNITTSVIPKFYRVFRADDCVYHQVLQQCLLYICVYICFYFVHYSVFICLFFSIFHHVFFYFLFSISVGQDDHNYLRLYWQSLYSTMCFCVFFSLVFAFERMIAITSGRCSCSGSCSAQQWPPLMCVFVHFLMCICVFLSDPGPIIVYPCQSLTDKLVED